MRVLVIEDEMKVAEALEQGLTAEDFDVSVAHTGEDGFFILNQEAVDVVILDLGLPGRDGLEILSAMRRQRISTPVLVLTARDAVEDRIRGLDGGADDYLVKPFAFGELVARVRALLRRGLKDEVLELSAGDLTMDLVARTVIRGDRILDLTPREFDLLECLLRHGGRVVSRDSLARRVWNIEPGLIPLDNVIDVHVSRLRKKLDEGSSGNLIQTIRGVGFLIQGRPR